MVTSCSRFNLKFRCACSSSSPPALDNEVTGLQPHSSDGLVLHLQPTFVLFDSSKSVLLLNEVDFR